MTTKLLDDVVYLRKMVDELTKDNDRWAARVKEMEGRAEEAMGVLRGAKSLVVDSRIHILRDIMINLNLSAVEGNDGRYAVFDKNNKGLLQDATIADIWKWLLDSKRIVFREDADE